MLIATAPFIAGWKVTETRGHVFGLVVRSRGLGGNIMDGCTRQRSTVLKIMPAPDFSSPFVSRLLHGNAITVERGHPLGTMFAKQSLIHLWIVGETWRSR